MHTLLLAFSFKPQMSGLLDLVVAIAVLLGTPLVILAVNNGLRLGFNIAITALFGWLTFMFFLWMMFPIAYKGSEPSWKVKEVTYNPSDAATQVVHNLPDITELPSSESLIAKHDLASQFKTTQGTPAIGDVIAADPAIERQLKPRLNGWSLDSTSNPDYTDAKNTASNYLTEVGKQFSEMQDFVVLGVLDRGGEPPRTDDSTWGRIVYKFESIGRWIIDDKPAHYAVVQVQKSNYKEPPPGAKPPTPEAVPGAPVISVVMVRDLGSVRLPAFALFVLSLIAFLICANSLHRRDKAGMAARAAAARPPELDDPGRDSSSGGAALERPQEKEPEAAGVT